MMRHVLKKKKDFLVGLYVGVFCYMCVRIVRVEGAYTESCVREEVLRLGRGCFLWCVFLLLALCWCPLESKTEDKCLILREQKI